MVVGRAFFNGSRTGHVCGFLGGVSTVLEGGVRGFGGGTSMVLRGCSWFQGGGRSVL